MIRSQIGSTFNLVASQFEHVDRILFAEDVSDFKVLSDIAHTLGTKLTTFNIPLHGFSEYRKAVPFTDSYKLLIGSDPKYVRTREEINCTLLIAICPDWNDETESARS